MAKLVDQRQLKSLKGIPYSATQIWRLEKAGQFPQRITLGGNRVAWLENEIDAWIEAKAELRQSSAANQGGNSDLP